jgi:hypothetical protein
MEVVAPDSPIYCLLPAGAAEDAERAVTEQLAQHPAIRVLIERRRAERRVAADRRSRKSAEGADAERRRIRSQAGRRVADRRAELIPVEGLTLPSTLGVAFN